MTFLAFLAGVAVGVIVTMCAMVLYYISDKEDNHD